MKILVCPAPFKGTLSSTEAARTMIQGLKHALPSAECIPLPLADGGEGTLDVLLQDGAQRFVESVQGPDGRPVQASWGVLSDGTALVEMAQASGLQLVSPATNNLFAASTFGTGELIRAAISSGRRHLIVSLGGSATNDAGVGAMQALGARFFKGSDELRAVGDVVECAERIDLTQFISTDGIEVTGAADVDVPLCGDRGATRLFSAQKGATPGVADELERRMVRFAKVLHRHFGWDVASATGAGAAGGMGSALLAFLRARMVPGIELIMDRIGFDEKARWADWIITGEGRLDEQSVRGKVIAGIIRRRQGKPVVALCGRVELARELWQGWGLSRAYSIGELDPAAGPPELRLQRASEKLAQLMLRSFH